MELLRKKNLEEMRKKMAIYCM